MKFSIHDHNCKSQQNCGKDTNQDAPCSPRKVDMTGVSPPPPATSPASTSKQPPTNVLSKTFYPQWLWVVATSVTSE
jgi:hypothetical protein